MTVIRAWKKVFEGDLNNIVIELKESLAVPSILYLDGPVGAGKTTFTRYFIDSKDVQSPTYSLVNEYDHILHADLYRIEKKEELIHLELPMYIEEKDYFVIEWGLQHRNSIEKIIGDEFKPYQLTIEINPQSSSGMQSRNYSLIKL